MDITVSPLSSIKALEECAACIEKRRYAYAGAEAAEKKMKGTYHEDASSLGLTIINVLEPEKKEAYVIARKL